MSYNDYDSEDGDSNLEYSEDEYNSEDDEFLAFHDADIEAQVDKLEVFWADCHWCQVRAEIEKMKRRTEEAELFNTELVQAADPAKISSAVSQQISLLGSRRLYERIDKNLKLAKFEAHFAKVKHAEVSWDTEISFLARSSLTCTAGGRNISTTSSQRTAGSLTGLTTVMTSTQFPSRLVIDSIGDQ